jgi:hypothetical protein
MVTLILVLAAGGAALSGGYALSIAVRPYAECDRCAGTGERGRGMLRRQCRRCRGHGHRPRLGARVWAWRTARRRPPAESDGVPEARVKVWG